MNDNFEQYKKKLRKYIMDGTSVELVTIATKICF